MSRAWRLPLLRVAVAALTALVAGGAMAADLSEGRRIYVEVCAACHANGVVGAPRYGNREDWGPRLRRDRQDLLRSVFKGRGSMPPKGGNASVTDAQAEAAMEYMLSSVR